MSGEPERLLTVPEIAHWLAVSEGWVREHAAELGGIRLNANPRGPLRFERTRVAEALERRRLATTPEPSPARRPGPRHKPKDNVKLIELPGWAR